MIVLKVAKWGKPEPTVEEAVFAHFKMPLPKAVYRPKAEEEAAIFAHFKAVRK